MPEPMDVLKQGLAELYKSSEFTDFEIECGGQIFKVHKAVICAQSKYFRAPCGKSYAEGSEGRIVLKPASDDGEDDSACDDPQAIQLMVDFFYHLDYEVDKEMPSDGTDQGIATNSPRQTRASVSDQRTQTPYPYVLPGTNRLTMGGRPKPSIVQDPYSQVLPTEAPIADAITHAKVFAAAVKYQVIALQGVAATKFAAAAATSWDHPSFAEASRIAYTTTPDQYRKLRDTVSQTIHKHHHLLNKSDMENVIKATPDLHFELLRMARGLPAMNRDDEDDGIPCEFCGHSTCPSYCRLLN
ncbi:hypothetical protein LTR56_000761 [Elasticomyces elasticus]|nr:hypothetical protein LTR22_009083 [Elasticomyces elasticus]KAK3660385.1 hypothetical protein LTR56_000761 [Elasticomyces elasticus]KAK4929224.1 hypothetical protein LTR49_004121 [Elasticomyces elasticus]KAK5765780.1 hypothetical protein LTS12_004040 [Elasticomyces elasticus]